MRSSFLRLLSDDRRRLNMKGILVLSVFLASLAVSVCRPQISSKDATILDQNNNFNGIDPWKWNYRSSDGTEREEEGVLEDGKLRVRGRYSWTDPDGVAHSMSFVADENGFRVEPIPSLAAAPPRRTMTRLGLNTGLSLLGKR